MPRRRRQILGPPPPNVSPPTWVPPKVRVPLRERPTFVLFVNVVAVCCGLFIFAFLAVIAYSVWRMNGPNLRSVGAAIAAPLAGFESWRQTLKLNLR